MAGDNSGPINGSYATGDVLGYNNVGGLVGVSKVGTISASYANGNVSGSGVNIGGEHISGTGGLAGFNGGTIIASYATGRVSSSSIYEFVGGLVGSNSGKATSGFWDTQASAYETDVGHGDSMGVEGKTTAELHRPPDTPASTPPGTPMAATLGTLAQAASIRP